MIADRSHRSMAWFAIVAMSATAVISWFVVRPDRRREIDADPGALTEISYIRPDGVPPLELADSTSAWNLSSAVEVSANVGASHGGLALHDIDADGDLDLVLARGTLEVWLWDGERFSEPLRVDIDDAVAVDVADVDSDAWPDLLVARSGPVDAVVWGGDWVSARTQPAMTELEGSQPSAALQAAELSGDDRIDLVRLGRGADRGEPDVLWVADDALNRSFSKIELGTDRRLSLSAEIFDADLDGLNDIWVTRDLGWVNGPDSVYSRRGDPEGEFVDVANELGADLAIDGMGITIADLDGDAVLDAYVSDLGDNEVLIRSDGVFVTTRETGAARIRAPGAPESTISSSWATGSADINLDGRLDLVVVNGGFSDSAMTNKVAGTDVSVVDSPSILLGIGDGRFVDGWPDMDLDWNSSGRGLTIGDIDTDGDDDLVILSDDGTLRAFENRSTAPSLSISVSQRCDVTGATVTVVGEGGRVFQSLLRRHTYNGAHAVQLAIGVTIPQPDVSVVWPDGGVATPRVIADDDGRQRSVVDCPAR